MLFKNLRYWSCLPLGEGAERSEAEGGCDANDFNIFRLAQPSVIAYGDASSLDAKTQFVASYAPRETASRANVALRRREHIEVGCNCEL